MQFENWIGERIRHAKGSEPRSDGAHKDISILRLIGTEEQAANHDVVAGVDKPAGTEVAQLRRGTLIEVLDTPRRGERRARRIRTITDRGVETGERVIKVSLPTPSRLSSGRRRCSMSIICKRSFRRDFVAELATPVRVQLQDWIGERLGDADVGERRSIGAQEESLRITRRQDLNHSDLNLIAGSYVQPVVDVERLRRRGGSRSWCGCRSYSCPHGG